MNEKSFILIQISLKFVPYGPIDTIPALALMMARRRPGNKPLSEPMLTQFTEAYMRHNGRWIKVKESKNQNAHNDTISYFEYDIITQQI